jgi:NADH-quinone oxidoreductase subunit M
VFFGPERDGGHGHDGHGHGDHADGHSGPRDMTFVEGAALVPLCVFVLWIGLYPEFFLSRLRPALEPAVKPAMAELAKQQGRSSAVAESERQRGDLSLVE